MGFTGLSPIDEVRKNNRFLVQKKKKKLAQHMLDLLFAKVERKRKRGQKFKNKLRIQKRNLIMSNFFFCISYKLDNNRNAVLHQINVCSLFGFFDNNCDLCVQAFD